MAEKAKSSTVQRLLRAWLNFSAASHFDDATWDPRRAQEQKLLEIIRRNEGSVYGREHGFADIHSIAAYRSHVPVNTYESLEPYVERTLRGEADVLTSEPALMFATTSGTTGNAKYIPVTKSYLHEYSHGVHVHTYRMFADYADILGGKMLVPSSSDTEGYSEGGLPYGAISGYLTKSQPKPIRRFYALPYELCTVKDVTTKYYLTLRHGLAADVRLMVMPNPSSLLLLAEKMNTWSGQLIADIERGTVDETMLADGTPTSLLRGFAPDPERAKELYGAREAAGSLLPKDAWRNLRLLSCWKGGTMPLYLRKLSTPYGDTPVRDLGYMASEGRGTTPLVNSGAAGVLAVSSHFFEFVPAEERDDPSPTFLTADELETDREYFVYFTTSAGLYRYDINDVVRVVDFYRNTPVVEFVRKGQGMTSITGEKLAESQVTAALVEVVEADGLDIQHFTARVLWGEPPCYTMFVELGAPLGSERLRAFATAMDKALATRNIEYGAKRESLRLGPPVVRSVSPGTYQAYRQQRVSEGAPEAQVKIPHLSTSMEFGDGFEVVEEVVAAD